MQSTIGSFVYIIYVYMNISIYIYIYQSICTYCLLYCWDYSNFALEPKRLCKQIYIYIYVHICICICICICIYISIYGYTYHFCAHIKNVYKLMYIYMHIAFVCKQLIYIYSYISIDYTHKYSKTCGVLFAKKFQTSGGSIITLTCTGFHRNCEYSYIYVYIYMYRICRHILSICFF